MSFVARGKEGTEEGKIESRTIRITESFVITNRKPCRRRRYEGGRAGKKINQPKSTREIASATPPGRHVDVDVDVASVGHDIRVLHSPRDRSIDPLSRSRE